MMYASRLDVPIARIYEHERRQWAISNPCPFCYYAGFGLYYCVWPYDWKGIQEGEGRFRKNVLPVKG